MSTRITSSFIESFPVGILRADLDGKCVYVNPKWREIAGVSDESAMGTGWLKAIHYEDHTQVLKNWNMAVKQLKPFRVEYRFNSEDGVGSWVIGLISMERDPSGIVSGFCEVVHEIGGLHSTREQLELTRTALDQIEEGLFISDKDGNIISANQSLCTLFGYNLEEIIGQTPNLFQSDQQNDIFSSKIWQTLLNEKKWSGEMWTRRKDSHLFPVMMTILAIHDPKGEVKNLVCVYSDLTDIKQRDKKLAHTTTHDALTNLPNRGLFLDRLGQILLHAKRDKTTVGVSVVDIDLFKKVNDSLGPAVGDELIKMFANRLRETVRKEDTVCRLGGDEFSIIHPNVKSAETLAQVMQRIFRSLSKPFYLGGQDLYMTASVGITISPDDGKDPEELLNNADLTKSRAKDTGRNNFKFFTRSLDKRAVALLSMENSIRDGLMRGHFLLHYQPKVDISTGKITGMEALVRWNQDGSKMVSPVEFIPIAEETGLIVPLGDWIIREACFQTAIWQATVSDLRVAVNLSARQFREKNMLARIDSALRDSGLHPDNLEIEITESMLMDNVEEVITILNQIKYRGISIALDDFGTGYSSLSVLKEFPIDTLKVDQSFIRDLVLDSQDAQIVTAIISMAQSLDLKVVAEGVENRDQLEFLKDKKCNMIQGYYYSKPLSADDFTQLLTEGREVLKIE
jgi:diguanylate cyclase (GGDEF)-like protein/PAS domain S-box-containing protein